MTQPQMAPEEAEDFSLTLGREQLVIRRRYQFISILNDFMIGVWFLIGSTFFLSSTLEDAGTWLFIVGSAQLVIRPVIRLSHHIHLRRLPAQSWNY